ncbi:signal peptide peptidase, putative [Trypanosoma equiperdum]|uniref:Signal peptide peptidase, putative n=2 Tax=Trypanozoon TaxID=39700 RepID=Q582P4_TRYB2|nr:signal peptide peptidase, putative [Trypanosoma brucei brucei TREU927]AAX80660.1 signal peptide peptidase, putative [Trypanosoma brucei]AAZ10524.1 signal peptide peptidase, putative [Trypanosoma brucei brucei TREU927]SCU68732.1 signal peptide peptidase, putative [Trypanosoma equiperdum]
MPSPSETIQLSIALAYLMASAVTIVYMGSQRLLRETIKMKKRSGNQSEVMKTGDAMMMPLMGSVVLFSVYVILRFVPREYFNSIVSFYLSIFGVFSLGSFVKTYTRPNVLTGCFCCVAGGLYYITGNWLVNNILATGIAVSAISSIHLGSFKSSFVLLLGLFFYDIFWVFGSDVMLMVASGVDGPIKLVFPRDIFGGCKSMSLLGLGDLIIPGFFIGQTLVFSSQYVKKGSLYFNVALTAYGLSLVNTMAVMVIFDHGQPALLFIVPWLLVSFSITAVIQGDYKAAWEYTSDAVTEPDNSSTDKVKSEEGDQRDAGDEMGLGDFLVKQMKGLFVWDGEEEEEEVCEGTKKND